MVGCPIPALLASSEEEETQPWSHRKPLARWVSLCKWWHLPVSAVQMGTRVVTAWPTMGSSNPVYFASLPQPLWLITHGSTCPLCFLVPLSVPHTGACVAKPPCVGSPVLGVGAGGRSCASCCCWLVCFRASSLISKS